MHLHRGHRCLPATAVPVMLALSLGGCSWLQVHSDHRQPEVPDTWQAPSASSAPPVDDWLRDFGDDDMIALAAAADDSSHVLAEQRAVVEEARAGLRATGAARWPSIGFALDVSERQAGVDFSRSTSSAGAQLQATFEVDVWGRLSDLERAALLTWEQRKAEYGARRIEVLAGVARDWYSLVEARQRIDLLEARLVNLRQNLVVIEDGYRLGLSESLDVYLARNQIEQELANVSEARQARDDARRALEIARAEYPAATIESGHALPSLDPRFATGVPSDLLARRPDILAAWYALMSADSDVAAARKARFPRLTLNADVGRSALELIKLVSDSTLTWSLAAGLSQPLFDAGRLAAEESQARARAVALEQQYLRTVFLAFSEVEQALSLDRSLRDRLHAIERARDNAVAAEELSFDQYRRGIVDYATVLEAQRRAFDARTQLISLRADLLRNAVVLHAALGGSPLGT